jgi:hypothetical protein
VARAKRTATPKRGKAEAPAPGDTPDKPAGKGPGGLPLPSPSAGTNLVIADIVLRAAGGLLRDRLEKGLLIKGHGKDKADKLVGNRGLASSLALYGASRLARRSPIGLAVVAGGLAAKVFYDRGKRLEAKRRAGKAPAPPSADSES